MSRPEPRMAPRTLPPPRPVRHGATAAWWLALALGALGLHAAPRFTAPSPISPAAALAPPAQAGAESFIAFAFGAIGSGPEALPAAVFRAQLRELRAAGARALRLEEVRGFLEHGQPLPPNAVLIVFEEAGRETIETADAALAELGWPAVAFVNVDAVDAGNINLVSRRRLAQMAGSGRWDLAVGACRGAGETFDPVQYRRQAEALQAWSDQETAAVGCVRGWAGIAGAAPRWTAAVHDAGLPLGFVPHTAGSNRRGDRASTLRLIRIEPGERSPDALARSLDALTPRNAPYADEFGGEALAPAWLVRGGSAHVHDGALRLDAAAGETGLITLGPSERWQDSRVEAQLDAAPAGQFWIYARHNGGKSFVRLGIEGGQVVLQRSDDSGRTRQVAAAALPPGAPKLALSVIGSRAVAALDGRPFGRPADLPADLAEGPVSLMAWGDGASASAVVRRVDIAPLPRQLALVAPHPDPAAFERLRAGAGDLWAVSPRLFRWPVASTEESADAALQLFIGHHRLALVPAVSVDALPSGEDWTRFRDQVLAWSARPQFAGVNLALGAIQPADLPRLQELQRACAGAGKTLAITAPGAARGLTVPPELAWFTGDGPVSFVVASEPPPKAPG